MSKKHIKKECEAPSVSAFRLETGASLCQTSDTSQINLAAVASDIEVESFTIDGAFTW